MSSKQIDLFGNESEIPPVVETRGRKKFSTMQELHGVIDGKTCKTCKHLCSHEQSRKWYKCELWYQSSSSATDIRLKNKACKLYEEEQK